MTLVAQDIPKIGLVMDAVKVVRWLKNVGDTVKLGEPLLEVETEKSIVEIEAMASGRLAQILVQVDQQATVGDRVAWIESDQAQTGSAAATRPVVEPAVSPAPMAAPRSAPEARAGDRLRSSPAARKLAEEHGLDLGVISGSGPGGRIQLEDVRRSLALAADQTAPPNASPARRALSPMRRALARAMTLSNASIPQFTVERSVDLSTLQALRSEYFARQITGAPRLSLNDFLLQAVARVLIERPALNATYFGDAETADAALMPASGAHIGLVLAVQDGLLVPVLHHVERLGLIEIARRRLDCVERGLKGRLKREETDGATFSISNLGAHGPDRFTAIINPPQSAILAVGRQRDCVVASGADMAVRPLSTLTLTVDHRIADGRMASDFLGRLVQILEGRDWRLD